MPNSQRVCIEKCPLKTSYTKFICHYDVQKEVDNDPVLALTGVPALGLYYMSTYKVINDIIC